MSGPPGSASSDNKIRIKEAVILMAGSGSRLRGRERDLLKPLIPLLGRPLISYTIDALLAAGIETLYGVIGFEGERLRAGMKPLIPAKVDVRFIENPEWQRPNGISLLAAAEYVSGPFVLTMGDHLFAPEIFDSLISSSDPAVLNVAVDKKIKSIFDIDDAMKVQTSGDGLLAIGKRLPTYDAIDIGLFVCPQNIFQRVERIRNTDRCGLADAVQLMAAEGKVRLIDIGSAWWHDVDTPEMLRNAEEDLRARVGRSETAIEISTHPGANR